MTDECRLFLYGTLRAGQTAHALVAPNIAHIERATTIGVLYALPMGYPGYASGDGIVHGELVWLTDPATTLRRLDDFEGDEYTRVVRPIRLPSGRTTTAWIYALADLAAIQREHRIDGGDWVRYVASRRPPIED